MDPATNTLDLTTQSPTVDTTHTTKIADPVQTQKHPAGGLEVCGDHVCGNGGTCHRLPGEGRPSCHCPLHFTGAFCEKGEAQGFWAVRLFFRSDFDFNRRHTSGFKETLTSAALSSRACQQTMLVNICWASFANTFHYGRERLRCLKNLESYELFRIWLMNWKIHGSGLNRRCFHSHPQRSPGMRRCPWVTSLSAEDLKLISSVVDIHWCQMSTI